MSYIINNMELKCDGIKMVVGNIYKTTKTYCQIDITEWLGYIYYFLMQLWIIIMIYYEWIKTGYNDIKKNIIRGYFDNMIYKIDLINITNNEIYSIYNLFYKLTPSNVYLIINREFLESQMFSFGMHSDILTLMYAIIKYYRERSYNGYLHIKYYYNEKSNDILINLNNFYNEFDNIINNTPNKSNEIMKNEIIKNDEMKNRTQRKNIKKRLMRKEKKIIDSLWIFEETIMKVIESYIKEDIIETKILHASINEHEITELFNRYSSSFRKNNITFKDLYNILRLAHKMTHLYYSYISMDVDNNTIIKSKDTNKNDIKLTWTHSDTLDEIEYAPNDYINLE